jgi:hypothetical protein
MRSMGWNAATMTQDRPARPVIPPPPPPSYYAQQAAQAFTAMAHSMGSAKPADAHKPKPAPKPAQSSLDACAGNITVCLVGYIRYHGGQVNRQGVVTLTGYHPGPANPGTCGARVCYNILTGRAVKPSVIPAARPGCAGMLSNSLMGSKCKAVKTTTKPGTNGQRGMPKTQCQTQSTYCAPSETQLNDGSQAGTGNKRSWVVTLSACLNLDSLCAVLAAASSGENGGTEGGASTSGDDTSDLANTAGPLLNDLAQALENAAEGESSRDSISTRDVHGALRQAERSVNVEQVWNSPESEMYIQEDGQIVKTLSNGDGTYSVVIRDMENPSGKPTTVIPDYSQSAIDRNLRSGWWS